MAENNVLQFPNGTKDNVIVLPNGQAHIVEEQKATPSPFNPSEATRAAVEDWQHLVEHWPEEGVTIQANDELFATIHALFEGAITFAHIVGGVTAALRDMAQDLHSAATS